MDVEDVSRGTSEGAEPVGGAVDNEAAGEVSEEGAEPSLKELAQALIAERKAELAGEAGEAGEVRAPKYGEPGFVSVLDGVPGFASGPDTAPVRGYPARLVMTNGICVCGHRMGLHYGGECKGVPTANKRHRTREKTDCMCQRKHPVVLVKDTRTFRRSWRSTAPEHPFNASVVRLAAGSVIGWLVDGPPFVCEQCGGGPARAAYVPGTQRWYSALLCFDCAPEENPTSPESMKRPYRPAPVAAAEDETEDEAAAGEEDTPGGAVGEA